MTRPDRRRWTLVAPALLIGASAHADTFAEFNSFATDQTSISGTVGSVSFAANLINSAMGGNTDHVFRQPSSVFNNSSTRFTDPAFYNPTPAGPTDHLGFSMFSGTTDPGASATLTVNFSQPVTNPVFHFNGLDRVAWDFSATTTDLFARADDGSLDPTAFLAGIVQDNNPGTTNDLPELGGSIDASVQVNGTYSSIMISLTEISNISDGYRLQISVPAPAGVLTLAGVGVLGLRRRR